MSNAFTDSPNLIDSLAVILGSISPGSKDRDDPSAPQCSTIHRIPQGPTAPQQDSWPLLVIAGCQSNDLRRWAQDWKLTNEFT
jgi:hypothetical protein